MAFPDCGSDVRRLLEHMIAIRAILVGMVLAALQAKAFCVEMPAKLIAIAGYKGTDDETAGRVGDLLTKNHIWWIAAGSRGYTISVGPKAIHEARLILARAVKAEGLRVTLYADHGPRDALTEISADAVLLRGQQGGVRESTGS